MQIKRKINYPIILQHLLFWLVLFTYQIITTGWDNNDELSFVLVPQLLIVIPVTLLITYINLYILMPAYYYKHDYKSYTVSFIVLFFLGGLTLRYLSHEFILPWEKIHNPSRYALEVKHFWLPMRILRNSFSFLPALIITMLIELMRNAYRQEKNMREMEKEKFSAEMGLLKAQINPHFFFNTLNSLYALTLKGSDQSSKVVLRLSNLMHYMLYEASAAKVLLKDEIGHLENYISIEQMRFADRLDLSFQYSGDITGKMIAPLLLLPFVENAFKHGISDDSGWITINLKVIGERLFLKVENSYPENARPKGHGLGLKNVKRRLDLTYPNEYELQLTQNEQIFEADLKLNL